MLERIKNHLPTIILGVVLTAISVVGAWFFYNTEGEAKNSFFYRALDALNTETVDFKMRLRGFKRPSGEVAIIAIDERSLLENGQWPWPRTQVANIIEELFRYGVKAVGIDVMYPEKSRNETSNLLGEVGKLLDLSESERKKLQKYKKRKLHEADHDRILGEAIQKHENQVVAGAVFHVFKHSYYPYQQECFDLAYGMTKEFSWLDREGYDFISMVNDQSSESSVKLPRVMRKKLKSILQEEKDNAFTYCSQWLIAEEDPHYALWSDDKDQILEITNRGLYPALIPSGEWKLNTDEILSRTRLSGFLNVFLDLDGTVREIPLLVRRGPHLIPSISLRLAMVHWGVNGGQISLVRDKLHLNSFAVSDMEVTKDGESIGKELAVDREGKIRVNFMGPKYTYPHISASELLDPQESFLKVTQYTEEEGKLRLSRLKSYDKNEYLKGKTVILGPTALGLYDLRVTPFDENYPGVEVHATVVDNLLKGDFFRTDSHEAPFMILLLFLLGFALTLAFANLGALHGLVLVVVTIAGLGAIDFFALFKNGVVVNIAFPVMQVFLLYFILVIYKYFTEELQKKAVLGTFEKYVSPAIVSEVMMHPDNLKLGGRKEHMSVFFSDIRGFTTISEKLAPERLSELLNYYLTPMTDLVFENNGTLDKYMGDAIMAFFGAPIPSNHHAEDACRCALANIARLKVLNVELEKMGLPQLDIGIGVNTGDMSVGNMGSQTVRNYTVMGDAVNLGSRIEGINKQYGTQIIISEFTEKELGNSFVRREIDWVVVKGRKKPVKIFELISEGEPEAQRRENLEHFRLGYELYHQQKWQESIDELEKALEFNQEDSVSKLYISRCREFISNPPSKEWDGVFVMRTK